MSSASFSLEPSLSQHYASAATNGKQGNAFQLVNSQSENSLEKNKNLTRLMIPMASVERNLG